MGFLMSIRQTDEFKIKNIIKNPDETPGLQLENTGLNRSIEVSGKILEAQYSVDDHFLLFTTEDCPFEEALHIYYLSPQLDVLDALELSAVYTAGMLGGLAVDNDDTIRFSFFEKNECWTLKILPKPEYVFFDRRHPVKRKMPFYIKCWLKLNK